MGDDTLDLTQGSTNDKFETGSNREIRTSALAVVTDDSLLYRCFSNVINLLRSRNDTNCRKTYLF